MSKTELTMSEAVESLNYFDQQEMKKQFGVSFTDENSDMGVVYATAYIVSKRTNPNTTVADIKNLSMKEIMEFFAPEDDDEESDQGKDEPPAG